MKPFEYMNQFFLTHQKHDRAAADRILLHYLYISSDPDIMAYPLDDKASFWIVEIESRQGSRDEIRNQGTEKILIF